MNEHRLDFCFPPWSLVLGPWSSLTFSNNRHHSLSFSLQASLGRRLLSPSFPYLPLQSTISQFADREISLAFRMMVQFVICTQLWMWHDMASSMTWLSPLEELTTATLLYSHQLPLKSKPLQSLFDKKVTLSSFIHSQTKSLNMQQNRSPCFASKFLTSRSKQACCMCALFTESERKEEEL